MGTDSNNFETRAKAFIESQGLLHANAPVVVALSGGADSVALLAVLNALGYDCRAAHCNFHLRGEESMRDMRHVQALCARIGVDLSVRDFDVPAYQEIHGGSTEMACRDLRYAWFADLLDREGAQAVAVGHHREDRVETFMLNLMRGTGIAGLTSMRPRSVNVVRPLLPFTRQEIEQYLVDQGLSFITDSSNASDVHRRNRLRNNILPLLEDAFPGATDAILRTVANLEEAEKVYRNAIEHKAREYRKTNTIDISRLACDESARTVLFEMLYPLSFTITQVDDILSNATASGARFFSTDGRVVAELNRGILELTDASSLGIPLDAYIVDIRHDIDVPVHISVAHFPVENFHPEPLGPSVAYFDEASADGVWELRHARRGDRIVPFGSKKSKLLSDIFASAKLSASQKRAQWVLTRNDEIVWLPGLKNSAHWSVGPDTQRYIRLYMNQI